MRRESLPNIKLRNFGQFMRVLLLAVCTSMLVFGSHTFAIEKETPLTKAQEKIMNAAYEAVQEAEFNLESENYEEGITASDAIIKKYGIHSFPKMRELVAGIMNNKGVVFQRWGKLEQAIKTYDQVIANYAQSGTPRLRDISSLSSNNKAFVLVQLKRQPDALKAFDQTIKLFGRDKEQVVQERVMLALENKSQILEQLERFEDSLRLYEDIAKRFENNEDNVFRAKAIRALVNKGVMLERLKMTAQAMQHYGGVADKYHLDDAQEVRAQAAKALVFKAMLAQQQRQFDLALQDFDTVLDRHSRDLDPEMREQLARASSGKVFALSQLNRRQDAAKARDEMLNEFEKDEAPSIQSVIAPALLGQGEQLIAAGNADLAIANFNKVIDKYSYSNTAQLRWAVGSAKLSKGLALFTFKQQPQLAINELDDVIYQFGHDVNPTVQKWAESAKVLRLALAKNEKDAKTPPNLVDVYVALIKAGGKTISSAQTLKIAQYKINMGVLLATDGKLKQAADIYEEFLDSVETEQRNLLEPAEARALLYRGIVLTKLKQFEDALTAFDSVVARFEYKPTKEVLQLVEAAKLQKQKLKQQ